ncbi:MAG: hypothetical protein NZ959_04355 [Armatimonadetes bacterium]|nr:hypothetical protein [Armatimonadota bacterium]MDW8121416.1 hypothetical protein [Armatimonadota bacterium]
MGRKTVSNTPQTKILLEGEQTYLAVRIPPGVAKIGWRINPKGIVIAFFRSFLSTQMVDGWWQPQLLISTCYRTFIPLAQRYAAVEGPLFKEDALGRWVLFPVSIYPPRSVC